MKIKSPIFIIGAGRSGSSIFHQMFCTHPDVTWLTAAHAKYFGHLDLVKYVPHLYDLPLLGKHFRSLIDPGECYEFWENICPGFSTPFRDLGAQDVTLKNKRRVRSTFSRILTARKNRLLVKITGWPRIGFLKEIFPDAKFIHVVRDGRAVSCSTLHVDFWWGWRGTQNWRWGELSEEYKTEWLEHNQSFIALVAIQWKILIDALEKTKHQIDPSNYIEIKYEELCENPISVFSRTMSFCDLSCPATFKSRIDEFPLRSQDYKWKEDFTEHQIAELETILGEHLKHLGYA